MKKSNLVSDDLHIFFLYYLRCYFAATKAQLDLTYGNLQAQPAFVWIVNFSSTKREESRDVQPLPAPRSVIDADHANVPLIVVYDR